MIGLLYDMSLVGLEVPALHTHLPEPVKEPACKSKDHWSEPGLPNKAKIAFTHWTPDQVALIRTGRSAQESERGSWRDSFEPSVIAGTIGSLPQKRSPIRLGVYTFPCYMFLWEFP